MGWINGLSSVTKLEILNPLDGTLSYSPTVTIQAKDTNDQLVTNYNGTITLNGDPGLTGTGTITFVNGVATVSVGASSIGTYNMTLANPESADIIITSTQDVQISGGGIADITFASSGLNLTDINAGNSYLADMAEQTDGKYVAVGIATNADNYDCFAVRINTDGTIDTTFGDNGYKRITVSPSQEESCTAVGIQSTGKIVISGYYNNGSDEDAFLIRLNTDGSLDTTFDTDGILIATFSAGDEGFNDLAILGDDKIVVAGYTTVISGEILIARYTSTGSVDSTFNTIGNHARDVGTAIDIGNSLAVDGSGNYYVAGSSDNGVSNEFVIVKFLSTGGVDTSFDTNGVVQDDFSADDDFYTSIIVQSDNKVIVAGYRADNNNAVLSRYTSTGVLDATFVGSGQIEIGSTDGKANLGLLSDDTFVLSTRKLNGSGYQIHRELRNADGSLNTSVSGFYIPAVYHNYPYFTFIDSNDNIFVGGIRTREVLYAGASAGAVAALGKFDSSLNYDTTFSTDGYIDLGEVAESDNRAYSMLVDAITGDITLFGGSDGALINHSSMLFAKYNSDGNLKTSWADNGIQIQDSSFADKKYRGITTNGTNKLFVANTGWAGPPSSDSLYLTSINNDGSIDLTFDANGGKKFYSNGTYYDSMDPDTLITQSDGKIILGGKNFIAGNYDIVLFRINTDGSLDTTFDTDGMWTYSTIGDDRVYDIKQQSDGKLLIAGQTSGSYGVIRLNTDGSLDTSFDSDGVASSPIANKAEGIDIQSDGKILVTGYKTNANQDIFVARLNTNGSLDTSFDTNGYLYVDFGVGDDYGREIKQLSDGKMMVMGITTMGTQDIALVRLNSDGSLDNTFGTSGKTNIDFGGSVEDSQSMHVYSDGRILISGWTDKSGLEDFFVYKLLP